MKFRTMTKRKLPGNEVGKVNIGHCPHTHSRYPGWAEGRGSIERRMDLIDLARQVKVHLCYPAFTVS